MPTKRHWDVCVHPQLVGETLPPSKQRGRERGRICPPRSTGSLPTLHRLKSLPVRPHSSSLFDQRLVHRARTWPTHEASKGGIFARVSEAQHPQRRSPKAGRRRIAAQKKETGTMVHENERFGLLDGWTKQCTKPADAADGSKVEAPVSNANKPTESTAKDASKLFIPAATEGGIALYSPEFYMACAGGGVVSCGATHTAVTPLDVVKCNMQVGRRHASVHVHEKQTSDAADT